MSKFSGVHIVGSLAVSSREEAFELIGEQLGPWVARYPDGEIGRSWLWSEGPLFYDNPTLRRVPRPGVPSDPDEARATTTMIRVIPMAGLRDDIPTDQVRFDRPRYGSDAEESYQLFKRSLQAVTLPSDARFLVTLPTPLTFNNAFMTPSGWHVTLPKFSEQVRASVREVQDVVAHDQLTIQWDCVAETAVWEGRGAPPPEFATREFVASSLVDIGQWVDEDVELGYHLCYGDPKGRNAKTVSNMKQSGLDVDEAGITDTRFGRPYTPDNMETLAGISNAILDGLARPVHYVHVPAVEAAGSPVDPERVRPIGDVHLRDETVLFLGVVDVDQGVEAALARVQAISPSVPRFGISTECGIGRVADHEFARAIEVMRQLATELS
jgi:hypothetical protein